MRIIARRTLRRFVESLAAHKERLAVKTSLDAWFDEVRKASWKNASEVKRLYSTASLIGADRIVFNIKGDDFRLVVAVDYDKAIVWIKWIGSHEAYDKIDVARIEHES